MPKTTVLIGALNRGVVSPKALGRIDIERMAWSAEEQSNWVPESLGSMMLRPGLGYLLNTGTSLPKYLPFVFAVDDTALIEFTDGEVRIIVDDAALALVAVSAEVENGEMSCVDFTDWTDADDAGATSECGSGAGSAVALSNRTVFDYVVDDAATAKFKLDADGIAYYMRDIIDASTYQAISGEWLVSGTATDYEARATIVSGTVTTGTTGSWLALGAVDREWTKVQNGVGTSTVVLTIEIRDIGTVDTLATATITLKAQHIGL